MENGIMAHFFISEIPYVAQISLVRPVLARLINFSGCPYTLVSNSLRIGVGNYSHSCRIAGSVEALLTNNYWNSSV